VIPIISGVLVFACASSILVIVCTWKKRKQRKPEEPKEEALPLLGAIKIDLYCIKHLEKRLIMGSCKMGGWALPGSFLCDNSRTL
jgi:hypothetical protein